MTEISDGEGKNIGCFLWYVCLYCEEVLQRAGIKAGQKEVNLESEAWQRNKEQLQSYFLKIVNCSAIYTESRKRNTFGLKKEYKIPIHEEIIDLINKTKETKVAIKEGSNVSPSLNKYLPEPLSRETTLYDLLTNSSLKNSLFDSTIEYHQISDIQEIQSKCSTIMKNIEILTNQTGMLNSTIHYLKPTKEFFSIQGCKVELESKYTTATVSLPVDSCCSVELCILMPDQPSHLVGMPAESKERRINKFLASYNGGVTELHSSTLLMFCCANAGHYETQLNDFDLLVKGLLAKGLYVLGWNYRGFGNSQGSPSMQNIVSDARKIALWAKNSLKVSKIGVYGTSMGGHAAKSLADLADFIVMDRSFCTISPVARPKVDSSLVQFMYDLSLDSWDVGVEQLCSNLTPKVVIFDPIYDNIIPFTTSLAFGVISEISRKAQISAQLIEDHASEDNYDTLFGWIPSKQIKNFAIHKSYAIRLQDSLSAVFYLFSPDEMTRMYHILKGIHYMVNPMGSRRLPRPKPSQKPKPYGYNSRSAAQKNRVEDLDSSSATLSAELIDTSNYTSGTQTTKNAFESIETPSSSITARTFSQVAYPY